MGTSWAARCANRMVSNESTAMPPDSPARLFLDTGVMIEGLYSSWGASKAVLIHATERDLYTVVLVEAVERELLRNVAGRAVVDLAGWLRRVRLERWPALSQTDVQGYKQALLPVLRHVNDLPAVVAAVQTQPDWVISSNREHWGEELAARTGLRIVTPQDFIGRLRVQ